MVIRCVEMASETSNESCMTENTEDSVIPAVQMTGELYFDSSAANTVLDIDDHVCNETSEAKPPEERKLSKRQQKLLLKRQQWLDNKADRRVVQKMKRKQKRREKLECGKDTGPSRKKLKSNTMKNSLCKIRVAVDCSFDDLMVDKDINKLGQQLQYCYSSNRRAKEPLQLYLTSINGKTKDRLDRVGDYRGWDIQTDSKSYREIFIKNEIVYLTSDSPNVLQSLTPDKVYVIGGLVDHNHHKSLCYNLAIENEVSHAQLPIGDYIQLSSRKVLTVNHVFEILLRYTETESWKEAFFQVIPKRKQITDGCDADTNGASNEIVSSDSVADVCNNGNKACENHHLDSVCKSYSKCIDNDAGKDVDKDKDDIDEHGTCREQSSTDVMDVTEMAL